MGGPFDKVDLYEPLQRHTNERRACRWLLAGNGRKAVHLIKRPRGLFANEHANLAGVCCSLQKQGLVTIGEPDHLGWRWVDLTEAGRAFAAVDHASSNDAK